MESPGISSVWVNIPVFRWPFSLTPCSSCVLWDFGAQDAVSGCFRNSQRVIFDGDKLTAVVDPLPVELRLLGGEQACSASTREIPLRSITLKRKFQRK